MRKTPTIRDLSNEEIKEIFSVESAKIKLEIAIKDLQNSLKILKNDFKTTQEDLKGMAQKELALDDYDKIISLSDKLLQIQYNVDKNIKNIQEIEEAINFLKQLEIFVNSGGLEEIVDVLEEPEDIKGKIWDTIDDLRENFARHAKEIAEMFKHLNPDTKQKTVPIKNTQQEEIISKPYVYTLDRLSTWFEKVEDTLNSHLDENEIEKVNGGLTKSSHTLQQKQLEDNGIIIQKLITPEPSDPKEEFFRKVRNIVKAITPLDEKIEKLIFLYKRENILYLNVLNLVLHEIGETHRREDVLEKKDILGEFLEIILQLGKKYIFMTRRDDVEISKFFRNLLLIPKSSEVDGILEAIEKYMHSPFSNLLKTYEPSLLGLYEHRHSDVAKRIIDKLFYGFEINFKKGMFSLSNTNIIRLYNYYGRSIPKGLEEAINRDKKIDEANNGESNSLELERWIEGCIASVIEGSGKPRGIVSIKYNVDIDGIECDLVFYIRHKKRNMTVNVEIDGGAHEEKGKIQKNKIRDKYLESKDINVARIKARYIIEIKNKKNMGKKTSDKMVTELIFNAINKEIGSELKVREI